MFMRPYAFSVLFTRSLDESLKDSFANYSHLFYELYSLKLYFTTDPDSTQDTAIQDLLDNHIDAPTAIHNTEAIIDALIIHGKTITRDFMRRNAMEGITFAQSQHVIDKGSETMNFLTVGSLPNAYQSLAIMVADDMSETYHWLNQTRIDIVKGEIYAALQDVGLA